jgi:FkbM family methyltransferase
MALQAVTRWPGEVEALAFEPLKPNLPFLRGWIAHNRQDKAIEVIPSALGANAARGRLKPESTMGHSVMLDAEGDVEIVAIDDVLRQRPKLAGRKVVIKIDVEGNEPDVIAGMAGLLQSGMVKAVIWERGVTYNDEEGRKRVEALRQRFTDLGFTAWRFASEDNAGKLVPFVESGITGNVFELAPGVEPKVIYDAVRLRPEAQPADSAIDAMRTAWELSDAGHRLQRERKTDQALAAYAKGAAFDQRLPDLYNNLGIALRQSGRLAAAEAAYRRSFGIKANVGTLSNLGNVLAERGKYAEAEQAHLRAVAEKPNDPGSIHNLGILRRDQGNPKEAQHLFERSLKLQPDNAECRWDLALCQLQQGDYKNGLPNYDARWDLARNPTRKIALPRWDGSPLNKRSIFLQDEQGFGDVLMFARFIPEVKYRGAGRVVLECQPELMRLLAMTPGVDEVVPRGADPSKCDVTIPLLSLPGLFGTTLETLPAKAPYLRAPEPELPLPAADGRLKIGLTWAGKTTPRDRSIPVEKILSVFDVPHHALYNFQLGPRAADIKALGADLLVTDLSPRLHDFAETAALLTQLDLLVTIDTSIAHLAGALGVTTFVLLRNVSDWRWFDVDDRSPWYPSLQLFRQPIHGDWERVVERLREVLSAHRTVQIAAPDSLSGGHEASPL